MKLIIAGSRHIEDYDVVAKKLDGFREYIMSVEPWTVVGEVVSGEARGVDTLGARWAYGHGITVAKFPADWTTHGRKAGCLRNVQMAQYADAVLVIWDGKSKGSAHMLKTAKQFGIAAWEYII